MSGMSNKAMHDVMKMAKSAMPATYTGEEVAMILAIIAINFVSQGDEPDRKNARKALVYATHLASIEVPFHIEDAN